MNIGAEIEQRSMVRYLKDRQDILDCLVRESRGRDRHDVEVITNCYWEDGADEHSSVVSAPEYAEYANAGHVDYSANSHNLINHICEIEGDVANCETYVIAGLLSLDQKACKMALGRYIDRLERRNGEWRIKLRRTIIDMVFESNASWLHALTGFLKGTRSKEDPSYQRPVSLNAKDKRWP